MKRRLLCSDRISGKDESKEDQQQALGQKKYGHRHPESRVMLPGTARPRPRKALKASSINQGAKFQEQMDESEKKRSPDIVRPHVLSLLLISACLTAQ